MIFYENRLLADDSHVISCLIFSKIRKDYEKFVVCCSRDWRFKGKAMVDPAEDNHQVPTRIWLKDMV